ncbi:MAG: putative Ig domain-containing protein [Lentisphaeria bacterium]|nr:putative Ig domain-containing protein [Lentisphaeria bacterium]
MADITVGGSLIPATGNTPLDKRSRIAALADVAAIENPVLGGVFYCVATGKHYRITALKSKTVGPLTVENAAVDSYEEIPDQAAMTALAASIAGKAPADHTHDFGAYAEVTKFEVYATDAVIPAGTVDADTGLAYAVDVPAGMTHAFKLRSDTPRAAQDVVIDWGDGSSSNLKNGDYDSINDSEWATVRELVYAVSHTYSTPGKYIVTISGKGYWGFQVNSQVANILSRIFASDLPVASWVVNLASCAANSTKLQSVLIPTGMDFFTHIHNASGIFNGCTNLLSATNFATKFKYTRYVQNMFKGCSHMVTCDFQIPQNCIKKNAYVSVFEGCAALTANIADLLPERGFDGVNLDISRCFYGCASLTGTVPASILWNDMRVVWTHANTFAGCPAAMLAQIPTSWGGTAAEVEDPHPITRSQVTPVIESKVDEAMQNLSIPAAGGNTGTGNILGGYAVKATAYNATTFTLTLDPGEEGAETDMEKFVPGTIAYVNELTDDIEDDPETAAENEEVWGVWKSAEIASVDTANCKITFTEDIGMTTSNALENIVCRVADASRKDAAASSGDRNFVTGDAASADGGFNTVTGTGSKAAGAMNDVSGSFSGAEGVKNIVSGNRSFASGGNNKITGDMDFVTGNGNEIEGQGAVVLGSSNREVTGVDVKILGDGSKASGNRANLIGFYNEVSGDESSVLGNGLKVSAKKAVVIGQRGELADTPENKGAVAIAGGDTNDGTKEISFIHRSRKVNALDETETEPAFTHEYRGRLKAMTLTIAEVGTVELDHDQYARWELTGTGAVTLTLANWIDGDRGEVVIDTTKQTFTIPAAWIVPDEVWDAWTATPGVYCMEIRQEGGAVFAHAAVPFNVGGGGQSVSVFGTNEYSVVGTEDVAISDVTFDAAASNGGTVSYSLYSGILPIGISLNNGKLTGTPEEYGSFVAVIQASSGSASMNITVNIVIAASGTVILSGKSFRNITGTKNSAMTSLPLGIIASDGSTVSYAIQSGQLPSGITLSSSGVLSGTPGAAGSSTAVIRATSGTATFDVTIVFSVADVSQTSGPYGILYDPTIATASQACQKVKMVDGELVNVESFGSLPAHNFRRCVMDNLSTRHVNYYLHPNDSDLKEDGTAADLTGADGDVMVEIPVTYVKIDQSRADGKILYLVWNQTFAGASPHPFFYVGPGGATARTQYVGAFRSVLCESDGTAVPVAETATSPAYYSSGRKGRSIAGCKPWTAMNRATALTAHRASGGHTVNHLFYEYLGLMMAIEGGSFDTQSTISEGFLWASGWSYAYTRISGRTSVYGNGTGSIMYDATGGSVTINGTVYSRYRESDTENARAWMDQVGNIIYTASICPAIGDTAYGNTAMSAAAGQISDVVASGRDYESPVTFQSNIDDSKKVVQFSYRGIENPYGDIGEMAEGIVAVPGSGKYYWTRDSDAYTDDNYSSDYNQTLFAWATNSGYIKGFDYVTFLPKDCSGSSTTYLCDYAYCGNSTNGCLVFRGCWYSNLGACGGAFFVSAHDSLTHSLTHFGARLAA